MKLTFSIIEIAVNEANFYVSRAQLRTFAHLLSYIWFLTHTLI